MGVGVEGLGGTGMAESSLHGLHRFAVADQEAGVVEHQLKSSIPYVAVCSSSIPFAKLETGVENCFRILSAPSLATRKGHT